MMTTILISAFGMGIALLAMASLVNSWCAFWPALRSLRREVKTLSAPSHIRVTIIETGGLPRTVTIPRPGFGEQFSPLRPNRLRVAA